MKLNYDCIRSILLELEKKSFYDEDMRAVIIHAEELFVSLEQYEDSEILYALQRMNEAGLIQASFTFTSGTFVSGNITAITYKGHEYLETVRDHKIWLKVKSMLSKIGGMGIDIIIETAKNIIKSNLGI